MSVSSAVAMQNKLYAILSSREEENVTITAHDIEHTQHIVQACLQTLSGHGISLWPELATRTVVILDRVMSAPRPEIKLVKAETRTGCVPLSNSYLA